MDGRAVGAERPVSAALLFDGDCGLCSWLAARASWFDRRGRFLAVPYQSLTPATLARYELTAADCAARLYVVEPWPHPDRLMSVRPPGRARQARRWGGAGGINRFLWCCFPWSLLVVLLYLVPPMLLVEHLLYRWVARHRGSISRRLGLEGCRPAGESRPR